MNKTIIINMNGVVFHIEEEAYEILKSYMTSVKYHFAYSNDSNEIVTDIENRLAEMFNERLATHNKQVITLADVDEITSKMGKPSDFNLHDSDEDYIGPKSSKTLFKDLDNRVIGGVCAGLAHYIDMDVKWVRIFTVILSFVSGIGLVAYLILWFILPIAKTRQEKLAMLGEPINLQSFKKSLDEGSDTFINPASALRSDPIRELFLLAGRTLKLILRIIGILIISIGALALMGLLIGLLFGLGFINSTGFHQFPFNIINPQYQSPVFLSAFLIIIIPLIALILLAIRVLLDKKVVSRYGSFAMIILWLTGVIMGAYYASKIASQFYEQAKFEQTAELKSFPQLTLEINPTIFFTREDSIKYNIDTSRIRGRVMYGENDLQDDVQKFDLFIEKSDDNRLLLVKELSARGNTFENALESAQSIRYQFNQKDSIIRFDKYLSLSENGLFRAQEVDVHLKVPVNTRLIVDGKLNSHIRQYNLWYCIPEGSNHEAPSEWIMTEEGLKCLDQALYDKKLNH